MVDDEYAEIEGPMQQGKLWTKLNDKILRI